MSEAFARNVLRGIDELLGPVDRALLDGAMPDYATYKQQAGYRRGLLSARQAVVDLIGSDDLPRIDPHRQRTR